MIEHIDDYFLFIKDCLRMLKTDGTLIITTPNRLTRSPKRIQPIYDRHAQEFTPGELYFIFDMFFKKIEIYTLKDPKNRKTICPINVNSFDIFDSILICKNIKRRVKEY